MGKCQFLTGLLPQNVHFVQSKLPGEVIYHIQVGFDLDKQQREAGACLGEMLQENLRTIRDIGVRPPLSQRFHRGSLPGQYAVHEAGAVIQNGYSVIDDPGCLGVLVRDGVALCHGDCAAEGGEQDGGRGDYQGRLPQAH